MHTSKQIAAYLVGLPRIAEAQPVTVTIKGKTYPGAFYRQTLEHNGKQYQQIAYYLAGERPKAHQHSSRVAFKIAGDERDWFIASYMPRERLAPQFAEYHPFGETFQLMPWAVPSGEAIDHFDILAGKKPYARIATEVKED